MTRYVVGAEVAIELARSRTVIPGRHQLVAPTLLRSQMLTLLYQAVRGGELAEKEAAARLDYVRSLRIRLLGDHAMQRAAWRVAAQLGWRDTFTAEYVALTQLQADALVTLDGRVAGAVRHLVRVAPIEELQAGEPASRNSTT